MGIIRDKMRSRATCFVLALWCASARAGVADDNLSRPLFVGLGAGVFGEARAANAKDLWAHSIPAGVQTSVIRVEATNKDAKLKVRVLDGKGKSIATSGRGGDRCHCLLTTATAETVTIQVEASPGTTSVPYRLHVVPLAHGPILEECIKSYLFRQSLDVLRQYITDEEFDSEKVLREKLDDAMEQTLAIATVEIMTLVQRELPDMDLSRMTLDLVRPMLQRHFPKFRHAVATEYLEKLLTQVRSVAASPIPDPHRPVRLLTLETIGAQGDDWDWDDTQADIYCVVHVNGVETLRTTPTADEPFMHSPTTPGQFHARDGDRVVVYVYDQDWTGDQMVGTIRFFVGQQITPRRDEGIGAHVIKVDTLAPTLQPPRVPNKQSRAI